MALTLSEIDKKIPEWIKELGSRKHFSLGVGYMGWDWVTDNGEQKLSFKFNFYFPNGMKRQCDLWLPNKLFKYEHYELDNIANIPALKISEENVIKLRFLYMLGAAHHWIATTPAFNPQKSAKYLTTGIALTVDNYGHIIERKWER